MAAVTLYDIFRDVQDSLYSFAQVKDTRMYLSTNLAAGVNVMNFPGDVRSLRVGQLLQLGTDDSVDTELVRVRSLDTTSSTATVARGALGTAQNAWRSVDTEVSVEPEFPTQAIVREINNSIVGLPPDIFAIRTIRLTVDSIHRSYALPGEAVGIVSVDWLPIGPDNTWVSVRRYRFDPVNKQVTLWNQMEPGQALKVTYRAYPTQLESGSDTLLDCGLSDEVRQVVAWGALYRLLSARVSGRLVDTRSETPLNGQYRTADPVASATRQVFALYTQALERERERQRLQYPVRPNLTF